jgi:hypothetical protein
MLRRCRGAHCSSVGVISLFSIERLVFHTRQSCKILSILSNHPVGHPQRRHAPAAGLRPFRFPLVFNTPSV